MRRGLRIGLTGGLGSGKSTVAAMLQKKGAHVLSADELGRGLMVPGTDVFDRIVERFETGVVLPDGSLDRAALAGLAFSDGRVEELNAIVHPATIELQNRLAEEIFATEPDAIVLVESALIFETMYGGDWRRRFDRLILVAAPVELKAARFVERSGGGDRLALELEARRRLARMIPDEAKASKCDYVIQNDGTLDELSRMVDGVWASLSV